MKAASRSSPCRSRLLVSVALALIALVPLLPVLFAGRYPPTHESLRYEQLTLMFVDQLRQGVLYPRWLPDLAGGHGYPTFVFYQPLIFYVASFCLLIPGVTAASVMYAAIYVMLLIGASGAYRLARLFIDVRAPALAAALLFLITPYLFVNLHVRGDYSELAAMLLTPWPLWSLILSERRLLAGERFALVAAIGAVASAALIMAHPATAMIYAPLLAILAAVRLIRFVSPPEPASRRNWLVLLFCFAALALSLSSPYWFVVWQNAKFAHLGRVTEGYFVPQNHFVRPLELTSIAWNFGVSGIDTGHYGRMPFTLGLGHLLLACVGVALGWRRRWVISVGVAYVVVVLAMTSISAAIWTPDGSPLRFIQFPWRLLSVVAVLQLFLAIQAFAKLPARIATAAPVVVVAIALLYQGMFRIAPGPVETMAVPAELSWNDADRLIRESVATLSKSDLRFAGMNEFDPIWIARPVVPRGSEPIVMARASIRFLPEHSSRHIRVEVTAAAEDAVVIRQFYMPGWRVEVNGEVVSDEDLRANVLENGLMVVGVPAGVSRVEAYYAGPPLWLPRTIVASVVGVASVIGLRRLNAVARPSDA